MGVLDEAEAVADVVAPQVSLSVKVVKWGGLAILALLILLAVGWVIWKLFFADRAAQARHDQVQTEAVLGTAKAGQESAKDAVKITIDNSKAAAGIDAAVREALHAITQVKGADQQLDPALDDFGRRAICLRPSAASLPGCQRLLGTGP